MGNGYKENGNERKNTLSGSPRSKYGATDIASVNLYGYTPGQVCLDVYGRELNRSQTATTSLTTQDSIIGERLRQSISQRHNFNTLAGLIYYWFTLELVVARVKDSS